MEFQTNSSGILFGKFIGFIFSFSLFFTILYFVLSFSNKIGSWTIYHIIALTAIISLIGFGLKRWLK